MNDDGVNLSSSGRASCKDVNTIDAGSNWTHVSVNSINIYCLNHIIKNIARNVLEMEKDYYKVICMSFLCLFSSISIFWFCFPASLLYSFCYFSILFTFLWHGY